MSRHHQSIRGNAIECALGLTMEPVAKVKIGQDDRIQQAFPEGERFDGTPRPATLIEAYSRV